MFINFHEVTIIYGASIEMDWFLKKDMDVNLVNGFFKVPINHFQFHWDELNL